MPTDQLDKNLGVLNTVILPDKAPNLHDVQGLRLVLRCR